jgi:hypothetical protein
MRIPINGGASAEVSEPGRGQFADNLSGAVQYALAHGLYKILEVMGSGLGSFAGGFLVHALTHLAPEAIQSVTPIINEILSVADCPGWLREYLQGIKEHPGQISTVLASGLAGAASSAVAGSVLTSVLAPVTYGVNRKIRPARPDISAIMAMAYRRVVDGGMLTGWELDLGMPNEAIQGYTEIARPRLGVMDEILSSYRRQQSPEAARIELEKKGFLREDVDKLFELSHLIPDVPDLIHMMVREAFSPAVIAKWGYGQDYPGEMDRYAAMKGLDPEWAKRYWYAHWELPSINLGVEMVHRGIITRAEFDELLRIADYPAGWRGRIAQSIYAPYTRVDTRRMYAVGVIDREQVKRTYLDLGYDEDHAENLTLWTEHEYGDEERDVTKTDALSAYQDGIIDRATCEGFLKALGYPPEYRNLLLARTEYKKNKALLDLQIAAIRANYLAGTYDRGSAITALNRLALSSGQIDALMEKWDTERLTKLRIPAAGQLSDMLFHDVLTSANYRAYMRELGYKDSAIEDFYRLSLHLRAEAAAIAAEAARKEAERAAEKAKLEAERERKEQERIAKIARTDKEKAWNESQTYNRSVVMFQREQLGAQLRAHQAQLKLESYEMELSLTAESTEAEIARIYAAIDENTRMQKSLAVELASINLLYPWVPQKKPAF